MARVRLLGSWALCDWMLEYYRVCMLYWVYSINMYLACNNGLNSPLYRNMTTEEKEDRVSQAKSLVQADRQLSSTTMNLLLGSIQAMAPEGVCRLLDGVKEELCSVVIAAAHCSSGICGLVMWLVMELSTRYIYWLAILTRYLSLSSQERACDCNISNISCANHRSPVVCLGTESTVCSQSWWPNTKTDTDWRHAVRKPKSKMLREGESTVATWFRSSTSSTLSIGPILLKHSNSETFSKLAFVNDRAWMLRRKPTVCRK